MEDAHSLGFHLCAKHLFQLLEFFYVEVYIKFLTPLKVQQLPF